MMTFGYSFNIWVPLLAFPTAGPYGAPRWPHGWPVSFVFYFLLWAGFITAIFIHRRRFVVDPFSRLQGSTDSAITSTKKHQQTEVAATLTSPESGSSEAVSVEVRVDEKTAG